MAKISFARKNGKIYAWSIKLLAKLDFLLVVIVADNIEYLPHLKLMRDAMPMPILVLSSKYNASEKLEVIQLGADESAEIYVCDVTEDGATVYPNHSAR